MLQGPLEIVSGRLVIGLQLERLPSRLNAFVPALHSEKSHRDVAVSLGPGRPELERLRRRGQAFHVSSIFTIVGGPVQQGFRREVFLRLADDRLLHSRILRGVNLLQQIVRLHISRV